MRDKEHLESLNENADKVEEIINQIVAYRNKAISEFQSIISQTIEIQKQSKIENEDNSYDFNALGFFNINERTHSLILATLLNPNAKHGQSNLFLKEFLKLLHIESPEKGPWEVSAEKGRIDILLKRNTPHSVIVIENKSNHAEDQNNQLYRYWYKEIYLPNKHSTTHSFLDTTTYEDEDVKGKYKLIYLPPDGSKYPNNSSLIKPNYLINENYLNLPDKIPIPITYMTYKEDITSWLYSCLNILPSANHRLKEFIKQYIELW